MPPCETRLAPGSCQLHGNRVNALSVAKAGPFPMPGFSGMRLSNVACGVLWGNEDRASGM
jgi:hypothetical protein